MAANILVVEDEPAIQELLVANLKRAGEEYANEASGSLRIATTHTQARYALPKAITVFKTKLVIMALLNLLSFQMLPLS